MHLSTAYRHALEGVRGVKLEVVRVGGKLYTSRAAIQRFLDRLTATSRPPTGRPAPIPTRRASAMGARADRLFGGPRA